MTKKFAFLRNIVATIVTVMAIAAIAGVRLPHDYRSEQIFLCPNNHYYHTGDTIWLQGVVTCNSTPTLLPYSRYLIIELITPDTIISRIETELDSLGRFCTVMPTDIRLPNGTYLLRAYTQLMRSFSPKNFAFQPITIAENYIEKVRDTDDTIICRAFPWGGSLASGMVQHITVWLCDKSGIALPGKELALKGSDGNTIDLRTTSANGLAVFSFVPEKGSEYSLYSTSSYSAEPLAEFKTDDSKPKIQCFIRERKVSFSTSNTHALPEGYRMYGYDCKNGLTKIDAKASHGTFVLGSKPNLFTIFLTDSLNRVLSESSAIGIPELQYSVNAPHTVAVGDSIVPVIEGLSDGAIVVTRLMSGSISTVEDAASAINISSQLSSSIPMPSAYVSYINGEKFYNDVTAWLATANFSRFSLPDAIERDSLIYTHLPKLQMSISGNAYLKSGYSLADGSLVVYNTETNDVADATFNKKGDFDIALNNFYGNTRFYFQATDRKELAVKAVFQFPDQTYPAITLPKQLQFAVSDSMLHLEHNALELPELTVKAYTKKETNIPTNKFYSVRYKDREEIERRRYVTLRDILRNLVGVRLVNDELVSTRGVATLSGSAHVSLMVDNDLFKNGVNDFKMMLDMSADDIESVEYMSPWKALAYTSDAFNGLLHVRTRNTHIQSPETRGSYFTLTGLAPTLPISAPIARKAGNYTLVIDVISPQGIGTFYQDIVVSDR
ncbi:MAG: Plug domain-containing protein [bacterium]|nr:Plug domain-containing protein [bacterium]